MVQYIIVIIVVICNGSIAFNINYMGKMYGIPTDAPLPSSSSNSTKCGTTTLDLSLK